MSDLTYDDVMKALRNADAAGDVEAARRLAAIADSMGKPEQGGVDNNSFLGQANRGIANAIDFVNPFDDPAWKDVAGGALYTGSAADAFRNVGIATATREPETFMEGMGRGTGNAAVAMVPVVKGLQQLRQVGGVVGRFADDAYRALTTTGGAATEVLAGGIGGGSKEVVEAAGGPQWLADTVEVAAPAVGIPVLGEAVRGVTRAGANVLNRMPITGAVMRTGRDVAAAITPMTEGGARSVARDELARRAGSTERAAELGQMIDPQNPLGLTPAEQTMDPEMLALQRAAVDADPELRVRLEERGIESRQRAAAEVSAMGGDVGAARGFFDRRLREYRRTLQRATERLAMQAEESAQGVGPRRAEDANSATVVSRLKSELDNFKAENATLWAAVPIEEMVPVAQSRSVMQSILERTPRAQQSDIPNVARNLLTGETAFGDTESVNEMHGLYSELRRIARAAMSGEPGRRNANTARIANAVADAILEDLGAATKDTPAGRAIADALAHTRAMHETFDQGAVGRILKRTAAGDEAIPEGAALQQTVGRSGVMGDVAAEGIVGAAPGTQAEIQDYLRSQFSEALISASGDFQRRTAATWLRNNNELMLRYPGLSREFRRALSNQEMAQGFAARAELRAKLADESVIARFNQGQADRAVHAILSAQDPISAARRVAATARKDSSGVAMEGVKGAFADFIVSGAMGPDGLISGNKMHALMNDQKMIAAVRQIFSAQEMKRLQKIAEYMRVLDAPVREGGAVIDRPANALLETVIRVAAAQQGGKLGAGAGMGGSLQTANIFSARAQQMLRNLTNDRARELLMDAVEDPTLMRELLTEPKGIELPARTRRKLEPYLLGGAAQLGDDREGPQ